MKIILVLLMLNLSFAFAGDGDPSLRAKLADLTFFTQWKKVVEVPLKFNAFHTQGMVKIGEYFYMSSVEVTRWPEKYDQPKGKLDRDTGEGKGHIFKFDKDGNLLADLLIGEGDVYHPGGIDYDGRYIWVPVTEYRPFSFSIIYRVDPATMQAEEVFRYDDSIGAIVHNTDANTLVGVNWGARCLYHWTFDPQGRISNANVPPDVLAVTRGSFYVAFQDCKYIGENLMFCSGLSTYTPKRKKSYKLGGWEIIDLGDNRPVHQVPVQLWTPRKNVMTNNPCTVEATPNGIRAYFVPDDDKKAVLYVFESI